MGEKFASKYPAKSKSETGQTVKKQDIGLVPRREQEIVPKDISWEFLNMPWDEFRDFLKRQKNESALSIIVDWVDVMTARRLKAFLEDFEAMRRGQKRAAAIRANREQYEQELNVFASGVKWIEVK